MIAVYDLEHTIFARWIFEDLFHSNLSSGLCETEVPNCSKYDQVTQDLQNTHV